MSNTLVVAAVVTKMSDMHRLVQTVEHVGTW